MEVQNFRWIDIEKEGIGNTPTYRPILIAYMIEECPTEAMIGIGYYYNNGFYISGVKKPVRVVGYAEIPMFNGERRYVKDEEWVGTFYENTAYKVFNTIYDEMKLTKKQKEAANWKEEYKKEYMKNI